MDKRTREEKFADIFSSDTLGLLNIEEPKKATAITSDQQLVDRFQEISDFYEANKRIPDSDSDDIREFSLASRLQAIKGDPKKVKALIAYDFYGLLGGEETKAVPIDDLIKDDPLGLLDVDDEAEGIFEMSHVKPTERIRPDYIAHRRVCKDFDLYEEAFEHIHADLSSGKRKLIPFKREDLQEGSYYVLRGVVFYMAINNSTLTEKTYESGLYRRQDGRTRCIFDNGTESTMLFRSLVKAMQHDGFSISDVISVDKVSITPEDKQCGYIYVLRSLSRNPQIRQMKNLYKIGYCSGDVTTRIRNAVNEPTYLMSDVEVVLATRCYNMDVPKLEAAIHGFFASCNQEFEVKDEHGNLHYPREWFIAPLQIIEKAIELMASNEADLYEYNPEMKMIVLKVNED